MCNCNKNNKIDEIVEILNESHWIYLKETYSIISEIQPKSITIFKDGTAKIFE